MNSKVKTTLTTWVIVGLIIFVPTAAIFLLEPDVWREKLWIVNELMRFSIPCVSIIAGVQAAGGSGSLPLAAGIAIGLSVLGCVGYFATDWLLMWGVIALCPLGLGVLFYALERLHLHFTAKRAATQTSVRAERPNLPPETPEEAETRLKAQKLWSLAIPWIVAGLILPGGLFSFFMFYAITNDSPESLGSVFLIIFSVGIVIFGFSVALLVTIVQTVSKTFSLPVSISASILIAGAPLLLGIEAIIAEVIVGLVVFLITARIYFLNKIRQEQYCMLKKRQKDKLICYIAEYEAEEKFAKSAYLPPLEDLTEAQKNPSENDPRP